MIYLIDSSRYKIVFDKSQFDKAIALNIEEQQRFQEQQLLLLTGQTDGKEVYITGHPFKKSDQVVGDKKAYELDEESSHKVLISNVQWRVIKNEEQEEEIKYQEIV